MSKKLSLKKISKAFSDAVEETKEMKSVQETQGMLNQLVKVPGKVAKDIVDGKEQPAPPTFEELVDEGTGIINGLKDGFAQLSDTIKMTRSDPNYESFGDVAKKGLKKVSEWLHYDGELGSFDYDSSEFNIVSVAKGKVKEFLKYIGMETDGSKIKIPDGLKSLVNTFKDCLGLESAPEIPDSVEDMSHSFEGCVNLKAAPVVPSGVKKFTDAVKGCVKSVVEQFKWNLENRGLSWSKDHEATEVQAQSEHSLTEKEMSQ